VDWLCVAYAAGSEDNSCDDVADCCSNAVMPDAGTARTDTGRDIRLQSRHDRVDNASDVAVVCPSGEAAVDSSSASHGGSGGHKHSSVFKSSSVPLMCSEPPPPPTAATVDRKSLDSELHYLSTYAKLCRFPSSPLENSKSSHIAKSAYMSPLLASDDVLRQLCPVHLIVRSALTYLSHLFKTSVLIEHTVCTFWAFLFLVNLLHSVVYTRQNKLFQDYRRACFEINFSDRQEGLTVSSIICYR